MATGVRSALRLASTCRGARSLATSRGLATSPPLAGLVETEVDGQGVAVVRLARAPVNSLNLELLQELQAAVEEVEGSGARAMVLTSAQPTVFCAGLDIMEMYRPDPNRLEAFWSTFQDCWMALYGCRLPTAAAVTGHSPAGGCVLAMSCDYRVMQGPDYKIGMNETALGTGVPFFIKDLMVRTIGQRPAELAFQLSILFPAEEALKVGLVDEVVGSREECLAAAAAMAARLAAIPSEARHATKMMMRAPHIDALRARKAADIEFTKATFLEPKLQENMGKYLEAMRNKSRKK